MRDAAPPPDSSSGIDDDAGDDGNIDGAPVAVDPDASLTGCVNEDSNPEVEVQYNRDIREGILKPRGCVQCHTEGEGLEEGKLNMSTYETLRNGGEYSGMTIIIPFDPCNSFIVEKVGPGPYSKGSRMPKEGRDLNEFEQQLLFDWIAEGALNN
jgi:hypothetical protein